MIEKDHHRAFLSAMAQSPKCDLAQGGVGAIVFHQGLQAPDQCDVGQLGDGFGRSLAALLWMSTVFSAVVAAIRREPLFGTTLNHWDETAVYAALCSLAVVFHHAALV